MIDVELHAPDIPAEEARRAREALASLDRYVDEPLIGGKLTLRRGQAHGARPYVADTHVLFDGRVLAAHTTGRSPQEAADLAAERLRRQLRRVIDADVALRNELDRENLPRPSLKPPEERQIVHRRTYSSIPLSTVEAVRDLLDLDVEFFLFRHARTEEDVVVHGWPSGAIGLLFPRGSALADEDDIVIPEPSRYSDPLPLEEARTEMDVLNHRFLYFIDATDGRGKVFYLRHDGDYGLVEPE